MVPFPEISVAIPVYQGKRQIDALIPQLRKTLEETVHTWEIILVDDGSDDGSFDSIRGFHDRDSRIRGGRLDRHRGQQNALYAGLSLCRGEYIITMDDDGQHPVGGIIPLVEKMDEGFDVVYSLSRKDRRGHTSRWGTQLTDLFLTLFCGKPRSLRVGSYRIMTRGILEKIKGENTPHIYLSALIFLRNRRIVAGNIYHDVPIPVETGSRFSFLRRLGAFLRLFLTYGPLSPVTKGKGEPFSWADLI